MKALKVFLVLSLALVLAAPLYADRPPCPSDLDGDGVVGLADLAQLLAHYGTTSGASHEEGDIDGDGDVDLSDLAQLLGDWGPCP